MHVVQVDDLHCSYEQIGKGPLLVLLHGWANTWEAWLPVIPLLSDHYTLIIPNLPGFGNSEGPSDGWTTHQYASWLSHFIRAVIGTAEFSLAGHSFGGKIAAVYTAEGRGPQPRSVILIDASGIPTKFTAKQQVFRFTTWLLPRSVKRKLRKATRERVYKTFGAETDYLSANVPQQKTLQKILREDIRPLLPSIQIPTLLIWGSQEKFPPLEHGKQFHSLIHNSHLEVYDTGHFPHHEQTQKVAERMLSFLKEAPRFPSLQGIIPSAKQPLTTLLAILQQSEYEWSELEEWLERHPSAEDVEPKKETFRLKLMRVLTGLLTPMVGTLPALHFTNTLIQLPITLVMEIFIALATQKLRVLQRQGLVVVAVAGSYAKTSTKMALGHVIGSSLPTLTTEGNINTRFGIARIILKELKNTTKVFVCEFGEYNLGDLKKFTSFLAPTYKVLTPIGHAHVKRFGSEGTLEQELLSFITTAPHRLSIVHESNKHLFSLHRVSENGVEWYGPSMLHDVSVSRAGTEYMLDSEGQQLQLFTALLGRHNAVNTIPATLIGLKLGITAGGIRSSLRSLPPVPHRLEPTLLEHNILLLDNGYNSNPESARASLKVLETLEGSERIVITPGFVDMGTEQEHANREFGRELADVASIVGLIEGVNKEAISTGLRDKKYKESQIISGPSEQAIMTALQGKVKPNSIILFENSVPELYK